MIKNFVNLLLKSEAKDDAVLLLEDGTCFHGKALGRRDNKSFGEIVFNTGMTGYQEILTDPSYAGQIVTLTYTEIGNYGINHSDNQSRKSFAKGLVIKNISPITSSWRAEKELDLDGFLKKEGLSGIYDIDTRALTRKIRSEGAMRSVLYTGSEVKDPKKLEKLLEEVKESPSMVGRRLTEEVTTEDIYSVKTKCGNSLGTVAVIDFGLKQNMISLLSERNIDLKIFPSTVSFDEIKELNPVGIFLSNGPGDPASCKPEIELVKQMIESDLCPVFGVCLGHQLLATALGAKTFKLKFGHRGSNQPVIELETGKVLITSQNHGFAVDENSLKDCTHEVYVTHKSLNDGTVEGIACKNKPIFSVQYHPEASPGPHDTQYLFDKFINNIEERQKK